MKAKKFFWNTFCHLIENATSLKVWIVAASFIISTSVSVWILNHFELQNADIVELFKAWAAFNGGIVTTLAGMREAFKVQKIRAISNGNGNGSETPPVPPEEKKEIIERVAV